MLNISLSETIQSLIEQQVAEGDYSNALECIPHLILQEQAKAAQEILNLLKKYLRSLNPLQFLI